MPRVDSGSAAFVVLPLRQEGGPVDVLWNGWRPLYGLDGRSPADRDAAHRANVAIRRGDLRAFEAFLSGFVEEARQAPTLEAFLAHGRPMVPRLPGYEGTTTRRERADMDAVGSDFTHATRDALGELESSRARLEGRAASGEVDLEASCAVSVSRGGREASLEASLTDGKLTIGAQPRAGVSVEGALGPGGVGSRRVGLGGITLGVAGDRIESVEVRRGPAYARLEDAAVAAGVSAERRLERSGAAIAAECKAGVRLQLLDRETARRALSPADEWNTKR
jgi:hypothetical protein